MMRVGVISDTHGFLDSRIRTIFQRVDHILHAGDIGPTSLISQMETLAPVTAVTGNTDFGVPYPATAVISIENKKFVIHHIVSPGSPHQPITETLKRESPNAVIFGHTHQQFCQKLENVLYLNPGYSGRPRRGTNRSVAILTLDSKHEIKTQFVSLD